MRDAIFYHSGKSHWKRKNVSDRYTERNQYPDFGQYSSASYTKTHCQSTSKYLYMYPGNCWWIGYLPLFLSLRYIYPPDTADTEGGFLIDTPYPPHVIPPEHLYYFYYVFFFFNVFFRMTCTTCTGTFLLLTVIKLFG